MKQAMLQKHVNVSKTKCKYLNACTVPHRNLFIKRIKNRTEIDGNKANILFYLSIFQVVRSENKMFANTQSG